MGGPVPRSARQAGGNAVHNDWNFCSGRGIQDDAMGSGYAIVSSPLDRRKRCRGRVFRCDAKRSD